MIVKTNIKNLLKSKAALATMAAGTLILTNVATYRGAFSSGYRTSIGESRVGYMRVPTSPGTITFEKAGEFRTPVFTPFPTTPNFRKDLAWNSNENRTYLEWSLKNNAQWTSTGKKINIASAACSPQTTTNFWNCTWRELGETYNRMWRIEVNPETGRWQSN